MGRWVDIAGLLNPLKIISGDAALYLGTKNRPANYGFPHSVYLVIDKDTSADDATIVYRTNGNARAEAGIAEDDDYHIKTITGVYGSESFVDRLIVKASGFVDAVNSILRVNSATGTPTLIVGNSDGATAGAGVEIVYDQVNTQGIVNCVERGNTYRGMVVNCNGISYNFGGTTVANAGSFNQFGFTTNVPIKAITSGSIATMTVQDTGASGANLKFVGNGATTPNKYIRAQGGNLEFVNSAYGTVIATLSDAGGFSAGTFSAIGTSFASSCLKFFNTNLGNNATPMYVGQRYFGAGDSRFTIGLDPGSVASDLLYVSQSGVALFGGIIEPAADNSYSCGASAHRWSTVYAATGTINTSDARVKTALAPLEDAELAAAKELAGEVGTFQFLDACAAKGGDTARHHVGLTVQRAIEVMRAHGLDPMRYGFICHDTWEATPEVVERWGDEHETVVVKPAVTKVHPAVYEQVPVPGPRRGILRRASKRFINRLVTPERVEVVEPEVTEQRLVRAAGSQVMQPARPAGDRYGFRTDELLLFLARGFDARLAALEAKA